MNYISPVSAELDESTRLFYTPGQAALRYRLKVMCLIYELMKALGYSVPLGGPP